MLGCIVITVSHKLLHSFVQASEIYVSYGYGEINVSVKSEYVGSSSILDMYSVLKSTIEIDGMNHPL